MLDNRAFLPNSCIPKHQDRACSDKKFNRLKPMNHGKKKANTSHQLFGQRTFLKHAIQKRNTFRTQSLFITTLVENVICHLENLLDHTPTQGARIAMRWPMLICGTNPDITTLERSRVRLQVAESTGFSPVPKVIRLRDYALYGFLLRH